MPLNAQEKLEKHLSLVLTINEKMNLTRIDDKESGLRLHIEDSLAGLPDLNNAPDGLYGDMGTGAGYPGIPLAIMSGRETVLIDSVKKKAEALDFMIEELGLCDTVKTYNGRLEELAVSSPESFSVLTARALTQLPSLIELAAPLLKLSGRLICYKSQLPDNELESAKDITNKLGMSFIACREYYLSDNETLRRIVVFEKVAEPKIKLPRRIGMAQKRPLRK